MKADCPGEWNPEEDFCLSLSICHVHTSHYHLKTIQSIVRVWSMKYEAWSMNMASTQVAGRDSPSQGFIPPHNHTPSRYILALNFLGEICKKRRKMNIGEKEELFHSTIWSHHLVLHLDTNSLRDLISVVFPESQIFQEVRFSYACWRRF